MKQRIIETINAYKQQGIYEMTLSNVLKYSGIETPENIEEIQSLIQVLEQLSREIGLIDQSDSSHGWGVTGPAGQHSFSSGFMISFHE